MKDLTVPIDLAGRIVLPKPVREQLALKPGDRLKLSIQGAGLSLTPANETAGFVRKGRALVFSSGDDATLDTRTVAEIIDANRLHSLAQVQGPITGRRKQK
jgi:AbrB family looped-hinge helix DNA binding protein